MPLTRSEIELIDEGDIGILGIPFDENSSFLRGPAKAPALIINAIESDSANYFTEDIIDLDAHPKVKWLGNQHIGHYPGITDVINSVLTKKGIPFTLGGDHSITYPIIQAFAKKYPDLTILQFDAHGDLYDELDGNRYSHACPFARIMEDGLAKRLVQIGIRTMTSHQREQVTRFGVEVIEMKDLNDNQNIKLEGPLYVTFDMDVLDPAFAPGISHHEPGGMSTRKALDIIQGLDANIVGADLVEYNPDRDINGVTAMVAAKISKEMIGKIL